MQLAQMESTYKYKIDLATWKRKEHYTFFSRFEQPFFGISTEVNCTMAYKYCKNYGVSFFLYYLHKSLAAANQLPEFKYRIEQQEVYEYGAISGSVTVLRNDETFGFAYFDYHRETGEFIKNTRPIIDAEKTARGLRPGYQKTDVIHYSVLPRLQFNSIQHAQPLSVIDSIPKITFGKLDHRQGQVWLPIAVHVHHALADGLHVSRFIELFQHSLELY